MNNDSRFVDLGVSFFDQDFTLDPYPYIEALYSRDDVLGFRADGMNFLFRFDDVQQVIRSKSYGRGVPAEPEMLAREEAYAARYPNRAKLLAQNYTTAPDSPNFVIKRLMMEFLDEIAVAADFSEAGPLYARLGIKGQEDEYVESIQTLPLRALLVTCGLDFGEDDLVALQRAGMAFVKAFDNLPDERLVREADEAVGRVLGYLDTQLVNVEPGSRIAGLLRKGKEREVEEERLKINIASALIISLANTAAISSAFVMRTLVRNPDVRQALRDHPELIENDHVITELLRRDNHVKALGRWATEDTTVGRFQIRQGESINLFFPGVSLDPALYPDPLRVDLDRRFNAKTQLIFGGAAYTCIGKKLGIEFVKRMVAGFVEHLPDGVYVEEDRVEADGAWVTERVITRLPIEWD